MNNLELVAVRVAELGGTVVSFNDAGVVVWSATKRTSQGVGTVYNAHNFSIIDDKADLYWGHYDMTRDRAMISMESKLEKTHY